jgi:hypothetical protein
MAINKKWEQTIQSLDNLVKDWDKRPVISAKIDYHLESSEPTSPYNRGYLEGYASRNKEIVKLTEEIENLKVKPILTEAQKVALEALLNHDCRCHRCIHRLPLIEIVRKELL